MTGPSHGNTMTGVFLALAGAFFNHGPGRTSPRIPPWTIKDGRLIEKARKWDLQGQLNDEEVLKSWAHLYQLSAYEIS